MKLLKLVKVENGDKEFYNGEMFSIEQVSKRRMRIWKLYKRFHRRPVKYRVLRELNKKVPVGYLRVS